MMISFSEAQKKLISFCQHWLAETELKTESRALYQSLGFYLADDFYAEVDLPYEKLSAMDGYALCLEEGQALAKQGQTFIVRGEARAGQSYVGKPLKANECVRIMTGAVVPDSAHTVVIQENTEQQDDGYIALLKDTPREKNSRQQGEEIEKGQRLFAKGQQITPSIIPVLASQGIDQVDTYRALRVAFFASGDELRSAGERLNSGDLYESNLSAIAALLHNLPVEWHNLGIIADNPEAIENCLRQASENFDLIISSGGVSVGDYDYVRQCVEKLGDIAHYKVAMKPGKPLCFGSLNTASGQSALFFGLPGNAVSAFMVLQEFFMPAIGLLAGGELSAKKLQLTAILENNVKKRPGRIEFQRGILTSHINQQGYINWTVSSLCTQDSHRVYQLARANCTLVLAQESGDLEAGNPVTVAPFPWCFND